MEKVTQSAGRNLWERRCSDGVLKSELRLTGNSFFLQPASGSPRVAGETIEGPGWVA